MSWIPLEKEMKEMADADPCVRLSYFIRRTVEFERMWSLRGAKGWAVFRASGGRTAIPVWPHAKFAQRCVAGEWASMVPAAMPLHDLVGKLLPSLTKDGRTMCVFPTPGSPGILLNPDEVLAHLHLAIEKHHPVTS